MKINYSRIGRAIDYYEKFGYKYIEVPWTVHKEISDITRPTTSKDFSLVHNNKSLVASGEQGFLYLIVKGFLPDGDYCAVTPCFRDDYYGLLKCKQFMKVELISIGRESQLNDIVLDANGFFNNEINGNGKLSKETTENGIDITLNGIEIGSYGKRKHGFIEWVYGTGLAEPRFERANNWDTTT